MGLFKGCRSPRKIATQVHADASEVEIPKPTIETSEEVKPLKKKLLGDSAFQDLDLFGDDSDASDDEAAIDRYDREEIPPDDEIYKSRNVELLLSKMRPEEMFVKFDEDKSGMISKNEFLKMASEPLPQLGIKLSEAKAIRIFDTCDKDRSGEIDLEEFKMAMFTVDPTTGNSLGFSPSSLLTPKDAFHLFDSNGSGKLDELEFADALEYFGMNVSDAKQEKLFKKYDADKSGFIEYLEFRAMWMQCADLKQELVSRGVEVPKYATRSTLQNTLSKILDEEERREDDAMLEAKWFHEWQLEKIRRGELGNKAILRAQDELAGALDAAGQVYLLGSGQYGQFNGIPASRDTLLYDGYAHVSEIWQSRVHPTYVPPDLKLKKIEKDIKDQNDLESADKNSPRQRTPDLIERKREMDRKNKTTLQDTTKAIPMMKRRIENVAYDRDHVSPPKLNRVPWRPKPVDKPQEVEESAVNEDAGLNNEETELEELNRRFLDDRAYVRSLRFKEIHPLTNTGWLWGRQVVQAAITDSVAYAVTMNGQIYCWGGHEKWWKGIATEENDDDEHAEAQDSLKKEIEAMRMLTSRSELIKMASPKFSSDAVTIELETRRHRLEEAKRKEKAEDARYEKLKRVVIYYDLWDPPPSYSTRHIFMHQVLLPKLDYLKLQSSLQNRGYDIERATKQELIEMFGECLEIESDISSEESRGSMKEMDFKIQDFETLRAKKKTKRLEDIPEREKLLEMYIPIRVEQDTRKEMQEAKEAEERLALAMKKEIIFEASVARRRVQLEDVCPEYTPRSTSVVMELNGITSRGPPMHYPRGSSSVWKIAAGDSFACAVTQNGSLYSWGIGISGRLGHGKSLSGVINADSDHPSRVVALKSVYIHDVSCSFDHSAAISSDGQIYVWGATSTGKLGIGELDGQYEQFALYPMRVQIPRNKKIKQVSCGRAHTGAVSIDGELFMWGCANGGRLGLGENIQDDVVLPTFVKSLAHVRVARISCGNSHSALCSDIRSEVDGTIEAISGGDVYICGSYGPVMQFTPSWSIVSKLRGIPIELVSCGYGHTAAVSLHGELYTWGLNTNACTGHSIERRVIEEPELLRAFHVAPYNLALKRRARQSSVYNEQDADRAVDGNRSGLLHTCIHTQYDDHPWWEVDLGQPSVLDRIKVWNRIDQPIDTSRRRDEYTSRLFPFWILISEMPFGDLKGKDGLRLARDKCNISEEFKENHRLTEWVLPRTGTVGRYIRIQVKGKQYLHISQVEVFGVYNAFNYVGQVSSVHCAKDVTMVLMRPTSSASSLHDHYIKAIQADPDNSTILRQYEAYSKCFQLYARGENLSHEKCRLCRASRTCEICEFYTNTPTKDMPLTPLGGKIGLKNSIEIVLNRVPPRPNFESIDPIPPQNFVSF